MRLIIAGSRSAGKWDVIAAVVDCTIEGGFSPHEANEVVCGGARGADEWGAKWAKCNGKDVKMFLPYWGKHGKRAGHLRNVQMGNYATHLLAVWDGKSKGTKHMIDYARKKGLEVHVYQYNS